MGMSEFYGKTDDTQSLATLARAVELGINFLDTAYTYGFGHNETLIGTFLKQGAPSLREKCVIATKFGIVREPGKYERWIDNSPDYVRRACAVHPVAAVQSEYSLWSREPEKAMSQACADLGATFVAYSPLGRAFLTGTVSTATLEESDFRRNVPRCSGEAEANNLRMVESLGKFSAARGVTNAQVALAWLLNKHSRVVPISGTRHIAYLEQNVAATNLELSPSDIAELDVIFAPEKVAGERYPAAGMAGIE